MARLEARPKRAPLAATRVVIDVRPLQEPERMPLTADYLRQLLSAYAMAPLGGESFVVLTRALRPDPTVELEQRGLVVARRRALPPTSRILRSAGLTVDSFLLRAAEFRAAVARPAAAEPGLAGDGQPEPVGSVFHTAGGAVPLASGLPIVATLLDTAPWDLPEIYLASPAARFGHRLRRRVLHDAARVIVCSSAIADTARRRLHLPRERVSIVPLAVEPGFRQAGRDRKAQARLRGRLGLPERYLAFAGHYDARKDLATLFSALRSLAAGAGGDPRTGAPRVILAGPFDSDEERAGLLTAVLRSGAASQIDVAPMLDEDDRAAVIGGAVGFVYPALSEATAVPVLEALSLGVPTIASRVGALPEQLGAAGIVVEPRDERRLAAALSALWEGGMLYGQLTRAAQARADRWSRTWADVARETRAVYATVALGARLERRR